MKKATKPSTIGTQIHQAVERFLAQHPTWLCSLTADERKEKLPTLGLTRRSLTLGLRLPTSSLASGTSVAISIQVAYQTTFTGLSWNKAKSLNPVEAATVFDFHKDVFDLVMAIEAIHEK